MNILTYFSKESNSSVGTVWCSSGVMFIPRLIALLLLDVTAALPEFAVTFYGLPAVIDGDTIMIDSAALGSVAMTE